MNSEQEKTNLKLSTNLGSVLERARSVARNWCHNCVGPEHVLFAIMDRDVSDEGYAYRIISSILNNNRRNEPELIQALECTHGHGPVNDADTNIPLTPRTRKVLSTAYKVSKRMEHGVVCTLHFLLATLEEGGNDAYRALSQSGITYDKVLDEFLKQSSGVQETPDQQSTPKTEEIMDNGTMSETDKINHINRLIRILELDSSSHSEKLRTQLEVLKSCALKDLDDMGEFNGDEGLNKLVSELAFIENRTPPGWFAGMVKKETIDLIAGIIGNHHGEKGIQALRKALNTTETRSPEEIRICKILLVLTGLPFIERTVCLRY